MNFHRYVFYGQLETKWPRMGRSCAYDVHVLVQFQFQQFKVYVNMMVLQIQFIDIVLDIPVMPQRQVRTVPNCAEVRVDSTRAVLGWLWSRPSLCNDRCLGWSRQCWNREIAAVAVRSAEIYSGSRLLELFPLFRFDSGYMSSCVCLRIWRNCTFFYVQVDIGSRSSCFASSRRLRSTRKFGCHKR